MTVYFIRDAETRERVKIGMSKDAARRLVDLRTTCPFPLELLRELPGGRPQEQWLHQHYGDRRLVGEWFRFCPTMENVTIPDPLPGNPLPACPENWKKKGVKYTRQIINLAPSVWAWIEDAATESEMCVDAMINKLCADWHVRKANYLEWLDTKEHSREWVQRTVCLETDTVSAAKAKWRRQTSAGFSHMIQQLSLHRRRRWAYERSQRWKKEALSMAMHMVWSDD